STFLIVVTVDMYVFLFFFFFLEICKREREITAITIDSVIFTENGYKLNSGIIGQLSQFKDEKFTFLLTEVVFEETIKHIAGLHENRIKKIENLLKIASDYISEDLLNEVEDEILSLSSPKNIAMYELNQFMLSTNAELVLNEETYVSEVTELYFSCKAPFAQTGNKKNEFPDAIALLSLRSWAKAGNGIIVVSKDDDWARFCADSHNDKLYHVKDLSTALAIINASKLERYSIETQRLNKFQEYIASEAFHKDVIDGLKFKAIENITPKGHANYIYEAELSEVDVKDFAFTENDSFSRIRDDAFSLVYLFDIQVIFYFKANFSFFDAVNKIELGEKNYHRSELFNASLIIKVESHNISVEPLIKKDSVIDFGIIHPD
ncbi:PIN domain-containing protein, partial [Brenneria goodwinii]|uniref:PIN domain-containing protein n=1 Tax=Brenneria goodwinii TaxID=1109412 RepID=UPI0015FFC1D7